MPNNNYYAPFSKCALIFNTTVSPFQTSTAPSFPSQLFPPCRHRHYYASVSRHLLLLFRVHCREEDGSLNSPPYPLPS